MKKIFIALLVLFIIIIGALGILILTTDVNRFKPLIVEKAGEALQKDVRIENLSLNILPRLTLIIDGVYIKDRGKEWEDAIVKAGSIKTDIELMPLLKKDLRMETLRVRDMEVLVPQDKGPGIKINVTNALVRNISLYGPADINARLSIFGKGVENAELECVLYPEIDIKQPYIKNLKLTVDTAKVNLADLLNATGKIQTEGMLNKTGLSGNLVITAEKIYLDPEKNHDSILYFNLYDGTIASGELSVSGNLRDPISSRELAVKAGIKNADMGQLLPETGPEKPGFEGFLGMEITAAGKMSAPETLTADGSLQLNEGALKNLNVLTAALKPLNMFPGLVLKLENNLPENYKKLLKQDHTFFSPVNTNFNLKNNRLSMEKLVIESDAFFLLGSLYLNLDGTVNVYSDLFIPRDLSSAFIEAVDELKYLRNNQGEITMPVGISGSLSGITVKPDMDYVIQKLAVSKGQELLEKFFNKDKPSEETPKKEQEPNTEEKSEEKTEPKTEEISPEELILKGIFDIIKKR
jgi:hypothetical protein